MANILDRINVRRAAVGSSALASNTVVGDKKDPLLGFNFRVSIEGLADAYGLDDAWNDQIGFSRVSGIGSRMATREVIQGSSNVTLEVPSTLSYMTAKFVRGISLHTRAWMLNEWYVDICRIVSGNWDSGSILRAGVNNSIRLQRRNIVVSIPIDPRSFSPSSKKEQNRNFVGRTVRTGIQPRMTAGLGSSSNEIPSFTITLVDAWPKSLTIGDLNANENAVLIQEMEVVYSGIQYGSVPKPSGPDSLDARTSRIAQFTSAQR